MMPVPVFGLTLTPLGWDLMDACSGGKEKAPQKP